MPFIVTQYAQQVLGYSALEFGAGFVVTPVAAAAGMIVAQAAVARVGFRPVAATGMALLGAGSLLLTQISVDGSYFDDIFLGVLVFGLGIGPAFATATIAALSGVAEQESGIASGLSNTAFQLGGALGVAIVSTVAVSRSEDYLATNEGADPLVGADRRLPVRLRRLRRAGRARRAAGAHAPRRAAEGAAEAPGGAAGGLSQGRGVYPSVTSNVVASSAVESPPTQTSNVGGVDRPSRAPPRSSSAARPARARTAPSASRPARARRAGSP